MTQIASFDLGALAANRQPAPSQGASKGRGDFMSAFRHAANEARKTDRTQDADRAEAKRAERDQDTAPTQEADEAPQATGNEQARAERPEQPDHADKQTTQAEEAPANQGHEQTQAPKAETAETPADDQAQVPTAPAAEADQAAAEAAALDAQAVLALQLATGGQVAQPVVTTTATAAANAEAAAETQTAAVPAQAAPQAQANAQAPATDGAEQAAIAQAAQHARTEAKGEAKAEHAQAQARGLANAQATQHASANAQAQSPAFLAQAERTLGPIAVQTSVQPKVEATTAPVVAQPTMDAQGAEAGNLMLQLLDAQTQEAAKGSNAPVTMLDGADGTEMPSQPVTLLTEEGEDAAVAIADGPEAPGVSILNSDRGVAEAAKAGMAKEAAAPVKPEDVMPQVSRHLEALKSNQANAIKLQLYPEHLGKMEIKVVSHQGVLSAQLTADSHAVKSMLETQVAALQRSFAEMGLKVDKVEVTLSSSSLGQDAYAHGQTTQQGEQQPFGRQHQPGSNAFNGSGYQQWLGDEQLDDEVVYAQLDSNAAINYVA